MTEEQAKAIMMRYLESLGKQLTGRCKGAVSSVRACHLVSSCAEDAICRGGGTIHDQTHVLACGLAVVLADFVSGLLHQTCCSRLMPKKMRKKVWRQSKRDCTTPPW